MASAFYVSDNVLSKLFYFVNLINALWFIYLILFYFIEIL